MELTRISRRVARQSASEACQSGARASWRAASASGPTLPHSTLSTASKSNEVMTRLSCTLPRHPVKNTGQSGKRSKASRTKKPENLSNPRRYSHWKYQLRINERLAIKRLKAVEGLLQANAMKMAVKNAKSEMSPGWRHGTLEPGATPDARGPARCSRTNSNRERKVPAA